jgi:hypothetical protein
MSKDNTSFVVISSLMIILGIISGMVYLDLNEERTRTDLVFELARNKEFIENEPFMPNDNLTEQREQAFNVISDNIYDPFDDEDDIHYDEVNDDINYLNSVDGRLTNENRICEYAFLYNTTNFGYKRIVSFIDVESDDFKNFTKYYESFEKYRSECLFMDTRTYYNNVNDLSNKKGMISEEEFIKGLSSEDFTTEKYDEYNYYEGRCQYARFTHTNGSSIHFRYVDRSLIDAIDEFNDEITSECYSYDY